MFLHVSRQIKGAGAIPRSQGTSVGEENVSFYLRDSLAGPTTKLENDTLTGVIAYEYRTPIRT